MSRQYTPKRDLADCVVLTRCCPLQPSKVSPTFGQVMSGHSCWFKKLASCELYSCSLPRCKILQLGRQDLLMAPSPKSLLSPFQAGEERYQWQFLELRMRYGIRWIDAEWRYSPSAFDRPQRAEHLKLWIAAITRFSEAVLRKDLEKVDDVLNLISKFNFRPRPNPKPFLETLKGELQQRSAALASLRQTGIPEVVEVLCLLLWELIERNSRLHDEETAQLQRLLDLMQKAIADWDRVKNPGQIEWCSYFCGPIWSLRQSGGDYSPVDYNRALEDLRLLRDLTQCILTLRELEKQQQQRKSQRKEELESVTEMDDTLKRIENQSSAVMQLPEKLQSELLKMNDAFLQLQDEQLKMNEELQEVKLENDAIKRIAQESQQSQEVLSLKVNEGVQVHENLKSLESQLLNTKAELQDFRSKHEASSMTSDFEKLKLQKEFLNMKKDVHEMSMKFDRLTISDNLKMKKVGLTLHQPLHLSGLAKTEFSDACSDASWVRVQPDEETSMLLSASSGFSVDTGGPRCFMLDTIFKTPFGSVLSGPQLSKDTPILAADGSTILAVANDPEQHVVRGTVILETKEAKLQVTRDHRIVLASGQLVLVEGVPTKLTSVDFIPGEFQVLKITFQPDEPVAVFHPRPCIHSHGHKPKKIHRGGKHCRQVRDGADAASIPDTQGYLTD
ncbi:unnamed protein product [Durusdinium trenchii]|uniref:Uncharacterized protein n=2 Tax=Durusdinium trenchii TaxID=1381693 RepID=A0ABP0PQ94_9DINO